MGKFQVCLRTALGGGASYAWIALHRCVEANSNLMGETFGSIFARLENGYGFERREPSRWPSLEQIHACAAQLDTERRAYLDEYRALIAVRKTEKRAGRRHPRNGRLEQLERERGRVCTPRVGCWGWAKLDERRR